MDPIRTLSFSMAHMTRPPGIKRSFADATRQACWREYRTVGATRALRRGRRALASRPRFASLDSVVREGMTNPQADPIGPGADAVRLHRRALRRRVLRPARRTRDVVDLVFRHVGREIGHVPEDPEDLLVAQADVMQERDNREAAHVRDVLV